MQLSLKSLHLSFIKQGVELFTLNVIGLEMSMLNTASEQIMEACINRIQIDNTIDNEPLFPVVLKPRCTAGENPHNHETMAGVEPLFQFYMGMKTSIPNVTYVTMFEFLLQELEIRIEISHLMQVLEFISEYNAQSNVGIYSSHAIFMERKSKNKTVSFILEEEEKEEENPFNSWRTSNIKSEEGTIYIGKYKGSPMKMLISIFKQSGREDVKVESKGAQILKTYGGSLNQASISDAPMSLNALEIVNVYGPYYIVQDQLLEHYASSIKLNVVKLLGSSDLIGNPVNLVNSLGTGAKEFFYEPQQGFMQGPLEGGLGILKGTGSLVAHTLGGVSGTIGKFTNSVNKGVLFLGLDDDYNRKKELQDIKEKPKGALDGIAKGFKGLGISVFQGVTGVVTKPVQGAKQEGLLGFAKGVGKGVTGLVTKPVSGVIDVVSKTTQGIENQVSGGECKPNNKRCRKPRAFYKQVSIFKDFSLLHSEAFFAIRNANTIKMESVRKKIDPKDDFYAAYRLTRFGCLNDKIIDTHVLVLTKKYVLCLSKNLEFKWMRRQLDIESVEVKDNELGIQFKAKAAIEGFGEIKPGKHVEIRMGISQTLTVVLYLEDSQRAKQAREVLDEIKSAMLFEFQSLNQ